MQEELFFLIQSYVSLAPASDLTWPTCISSDDIQKVLIEHLLSSEHFQLYPPSASHQRAFWKWVIKNLEERGSEVDEIIYTHYLLLLPHTTAQPPSFAQRPPSPSYATYIWNSPSRILPDSLGDYGKCTLFEARTTIESGTTGLRTWTASFVLAEYLILHSDVFESSRVLELGSGAGFLGIIIAQRQIRSSSFKSDSGSLEKSRPSLYLTDLNDQVLSRCESNGNLPCNNLLSHPCLRFRPLDWSDALDEMRLPGLSNLLDEIDANLVLGADLVYDTETIPSLIATLKLALESRPSDGIHAKRKAIIAATIRNQNTLTKFISQARDAGLSVDETEMVQSKLFARFSCGQPDRIVEEVGRVKIFVITREMIP